MPYDLLLVRHAEARPARARESDARRPLTSEGAAAFAESVRFLRRSGLRIDTLLHSPWLRAVQTAELLTPLLKKKGETRVTQQLASAPTKALLGEIPECRVALVGHEPWMSELCALLVTGKQADAPRFAFKKGGVAWLSGSEGLEFGALQLVAFMPPRLMRKRD